MRLCLNSYALELGSKENGLVAQCLQKAVNAAMAIIQAHHESSQTDLALSFASDVSPLSVHGGHWLIRTVRYHIPPPGSSLPPSDSEIG